jgi:hypothetical protein
MKIALFAAIAALAVNFSAQAADFHLAAQAAASSSTGGCGGGVSRVADLIGKPEPCCDRALGCAQFLATTRVERHHVEPRT